MADARSISTPSSSTRAPPLGMRTSSRRARPASTHHVSFRDSGVYDEEAGAGGAFDEDEVRARGDALQAHTQSSRRGQANMTRSVSTANKTVNSEMPGVYASIFMVCLFAYLGVATRVLLEKGVEHLANTTLSDRYPDNFGTLTAMMGTKQLGAGYWPANIVGCIVLGIFLRIAAQSEKAAPAVHVGITTGFCGCCTTFATWQSNMAANFVAGRILFTIINLIIHLIICMESLQFGRHIGSLFVHRQDTALHKDLRRVSAVFGVAKSEAEKLTMDPTTLLAKAEARRSGRARRMNSTLSTTSLSEPVARGERGVVTAKDRWLHSGVEYQKAIAQQLVTNAPAPAGYIEQRRVRMRRVAIISGCTLVIVSAAVWVAAFADPSYGRRDVWHKLALGPFGAVIRYLTAKMNGPVKKDSCVPTHFYVGSWNFPLWTFLCNMAATVLDSVVSLAPAVAGSTWALWSGALSTGFGGSLSTVSTFIAETAGQSRRWYKYRYVLASILTAQFLAILIRGIRAW